MFPQSELDNYKLQVELLQEKLQRSEISRHQLEHKLDKILQKRDEHDKIVRSKTRQKYQQFLEEQERRNERNKQLVQMLERIEQQTEAMNARSEKLKMMKLQYEMYFAKIVHSQTRRCIQNSINPVPQMMPTASTHPIASAILQPDSGHDYEFNIKTIIPEMHYPYQTHASTASFVQESFLRSQEENMPIKTTEMPTLVDFRNLKVTPTAETQQSNEYQPRYEPVNNNIDISANNVYYKQEISNNNISYPKTKANVLNSSVTSLLPNDKQLSEFKNNSNLSNTASSKFEEIPNSDMMSQNMHNLTELPNKTTTITKTSDDTESNNDTLHTSVNLQSLHKTHNVNNEPHLKNTNQKYERATRNLENVNENVNLIKQEVRNEIKSRKANAGNELKSHYITMPKLLKKRLTSSELENSKALIENPPKYSNSTEYISRKTEPTDQIENESLAQSTQSNSSTTPVSIENIENAIYGELLSPLEIEEIQKPESANVAPKLLENLVTQHENIEIENILSEEPLVEHDRTANNNSIKDATATSINSEQNSVTYNYEQAVDYNDYNNTQQPEKLVNSFADYNNYENVDGTAIDEGQQQQQQQYDYSNYDPSQYLYPGYIYDETTGEYKPDPNAPEDQYATDQQYTSEGYDQQYQQQDYDYNQNYSEDPAATSSTESNAYNNNDTQQQEVSSNLTPPDTNAEQQEAITKPEHIALQPDLTPEEVATPPNRVVNPTSILSTADKNDSQKKKKRVNFIDSSETDESAVANKGSLPTTKPTTAGNLGGSSESDFDFSSSTEAEAKAT